MARALGTGSVPAPSVGRVVRYVRPDGAVPAVVTKVWSDTVCNLQVLLDGNEPPMIWRTSVSYGDPEFVTPGTWHWPSMEAGASEGKPERPARSAGPTTEAQAQLETAPGMSSQAPNNRDQLLAQIQEAQGKLSMIASTAHKVRSVIVNGRVEVGQGAEILDEYLAGIDRLGQEGVKVLESAANEVLKS